jgi:8-oxo-dGTP pyrophosphatase MutT (NUDIX family)
MKLVTLLFLRRGDEVLLAMKKRGFGAGKWNGVGGKVELGESIQAAAVRECQEEIGVTPLNPQLAGTIKFYEKTDPAFGHHAHIFVATKWKGEPAETEEMRPQWFNINYIPYQDMWVDDEIWYPLMFAGQKFKATFTLDGDRIETHHINKVDNLTEDQ